MDVLHIALAAQSQDHAQRFYVDLLGLTEEKRYTVPAALMETLFGISLETEAIVYGSENVRFELFFLPGKTPPRPPDHTCLKVENVEIFVARCRDAGLEVTVAPKDDRTVTFVRDFDGNHFEIKD
jgi:catechol 2,3-dioxygenase-like lactoylglutathione lyase family enzyme